VSDQELMEQLLLVVGLEREREWELELELECEQSMQAVLEEPKMLQSLP
jgi:hypothetical protein